MQDPNKPVYPDLQMQYNHAAVQVGGCPRSLRTPAPFVARCLDFWVMHWDALGACAPRCMRQSTLVWQPPPPLGATCATLNQEPV